MNTLIGVVALVGFLLAIAACGGVAYLLTREREADDTRAKLRGLELELVDLGDRLAHWQRRGAVRERRDRVAGDAGTLGQDSSGQPGDPNDPGARKRALRARARAQLTLPGVNPQ